MGNPRIVNQQGESLDVPPASVGDEQEEEGGGGGGDGVPIPPFPDGDGSIFVSIVSYRDGERCAETVRSLFENASDPDRVVVGLVEQNAPEDTFCLEAYCRPYGVSILQRTTVRKDMVKVALDPEQTAKCPRYQQVRKVAFHHLGARGPAYARSMARKVLGDEEYCMQLDAHAAAAPRWDAEAKRQWKSLNNEFALLSTTPAPLAERGEYELEGGAKFGTVPRNCRVHFRDNGVPDFVSPADARVADLDRPLLSHAWSAAFSFGKCHAEEAAPYDPFASFAMPIEQFTRYARLWTRGYDTYTPTKNIVYHDYGPQSNGHGDNEWFQRMKDRFRIDAIQRAKTILQLFGGDPVVTAQANLGLYGLGKRRSVQQFFEFVGIAEPERKIGNSGKLEQCVHPKLIPYDPSISPIENLFDKPDNLDPQPEYPLRTNHVFYQQPPDHGKTAPKIRISVNKEGDAEIKEVLQNPQQQQQQQLLHAASDNSVPFEDRPVLPSFSLLFVLWVFGLIAWCVIFGGSSIPDSSAATKGIKRKIKKKTKGVEGKQI